MLISTETATQEGWRKISNHLRLGFSVGSMSIICSPFLSISRIDSWTWRLLVGESRGFTELQGIAYRGIIVIVSTVLKVKEWSVNATDCMALNNRISYFLLLHRCVGRVTH